MGRKAQRRSRRGRRIAAGCLRPRGPGDRLFAEVVRNRLVALGISVETAPCAWAHDFSGEPGSGRTWEGLPARVGDLPWPSAAGCPWESGLGSPLRCPRVSVPGTPGLWVPGWLDGAQGVRLYPADPSRLPGPGPRVSGVCCPGEASQHRHRHTPPPTAKGPWLRYWGAVLPQTREGHSRPLGHFVGSLLMKAGGFPGSPKTGAHQAGSGTAPRDVPSP